MPLKRAILNWAAKREAALRSADAHDAIGRELAKRPLEAHARAEAALSEAVAAHDPGDGSPLAEAARLWVAARRVARFTDGLAGRGTGPCPEVGHAVRSAEAVLLLLATGNPGHGPAGVGGAEDEPLFHLRPPDHPDDGSFQFRDAAGDTWVIRDCEEDAGCTVVERLHRDEIAQSARDGRDPEPVQVIDVPPDLCGVVSRALASRTHRVAEQRRRSK